MPTPGLSGALAEHLDRAVEGHKAGLDSELGMVLYDRFAELGQDLAMGLGLDLGIGDAVVAISNPGGAAVAVDDRDHLAEVMQLHRGCEVVPNAGCQASNLGATTAIAAPAMTNWLYLPLNPRFSM